MMKAYRSRVAVATLLWSATLVGATQASTLATSVVMVNNGQQAGCSVTNIGGSETSVDVRLINAAANPVVPPFDNCNNTPIAPGTTCAVFAYPNQQVACIVEGASSRVRAAMTVFASDTTLVAVVPATK
jgi:hypothetical protein